MRYLNRSVLSPLRLSLEIASCPAYRGLLRLLPCLHQTRGTSTGLDVCSDTGDSHHRELDRPYRTDTILLHGCRRPDRN